MEVDVPDEPEGYFESDDAIVDYLNGWLAEGSPREIARAFGDLAQFKDITEISLATGERRPFFSALSPDGNPTLETLMAVLHALGLELTVKKVA